MYKKFTYTQQESYRLDHIAHVELGERKVSYSEFGSLHKLYEENYEKFIDYNIKDVELVEGLDDKMKFIDMVLALAYSAKVNYNDVFSQVRMWDTMIYNHLRKKNIVIPPKDNATKVDQYAGAYVKDPLLGMHKWIVSFDLNSLYPHLCMQYSISPENLVPRENAPKEVVDSFNLGAGKTVATVDNIINKIFDTDILKKYNLTVTPNYQFFRTDRQGFLPEMMEKLYTERKEYKRLMIEAQKKLEGVSKLNTVAEGKQHFYKKYTNDIARYSNVQLARKVQLNAAYGALGNQYFRFYDTRQAEAITKAGQLSIRWIETKMNEYLNNLLKTENEDYVVASDTDSIYITLEKLVTSVFPEDVSKEKVVNFLDKISSDKLEPFIDKCFQELGEYLNVYAQKMTMKREVIADKGLWTAKKRYILNVHDSEGVRYTEPKIKMMGIEAVKSSTPGVCRDKIKEAMKIMMNGTENDIIQFIEEFRQEFISLPMEEVSFPRGVNGMEKYKGTKNLYIKGTPVHVKGALLYNKLVKDHKISKRHSLIRNGDKIKFAYLKEPNIAHEAVISISESLPEEFGLNEFIDHDKQFQKSFIDPLSIILEKIGWNTEKVFTLESFFN
jgi:DNA polymerase elongation subunit (family B)